MADTSEPLNHPEPNIVQASSEPQILTIPDDTFLDFLGTHSPNLSSLILSPIHNLMSDGSIGQFESSLRVDRGRWLEERIPELRLNHEVMKESIEFVGAQKPKDWRY